MTERVGFRHGAGLSGAAEAEFLDFTSGYDGARAWNETVTAFGEYLHEEVDIDPWADIAARIGRCLAEGRAASFIRLGDGEGNLLALGLDEHPTLTDHCLRHLSVIHFGSAEALIRASDQLLAAFGEALRRADLIGIPGPYGGPMLLKRPDASAYVRPILGLASVHGYLTRFADELGLESKTGAPAGFHRGLLPQYQPLVSGRPIGIVTCRAELADGLRMRMGAASVDLRLVPPQAAINRDPNADTGHWPGRYLELTTELREIEPGVLWFVAAGMLGKVYCDVIRAAGGIAVDIGHVADIWAGVRSRAAIEPESLANWRIS